MTDNKTLEPCPFCGGEAMYFPQPCLNKIFHAVKCTKCYVSFEDHKTKQEVIDAWNNRTASATGGEEEREWRREEKGWDMAVDKLKRIYRLNPQFINQQSSVDSILDMLEQFKGKTFSQPQSKTGGEEKSVQEQKADIIKIIQCVPNPDDVATDIIEYYLNGCHILDDAIREYQLPAAAVKVDKDALLLLDRAQFALDAEYNASLLEDIRCYLADPFPYAADASAADDPELMQMEKMNKWIAQYILSYWEHFKAQKELALIYPPEHPKRQEIEAALSDVQKQINL